MCIYTYIEAFPGSSFVVQLYYLPDFTCVISVCPLLRKLLGYGKFTCGWNVIMEPEAQCSMHDWCVG